MTPSRDTSPSVLSSLGKATLWFQRATIDWFPRRGLSFQRWRAPSGAQGLGGSPRCNTTSATSEVSTMPSRKPRYLHTDTNPQDIHRQSNLPERSLGLGSSIKQHFATSLHPCPFPPPLHKRCQWHASPLLPHVPEEEGSTRTHAAVRSLAALMAPFLVHVSALQDKQF